MGKYFLIFPKTHPRLLDPEDEGTVTFQNVRNYSPIDML
jgi:hypothetical protein